MANYEAAARTNYFRVKDSEAFKAAMEELPGIEVVFEDYPGEPDEETITGDPVRRYGLLCEESFPSTRPIYAEQPAGSAEDPYPIDDEEIDIVDEIYPHLREGEVAVLMEAGHEKLRYVVGWTVAINHKGETIQLDLDNIYGLVEEKWGVKPTTATY